LTSVNAGARADEILCCGMKAIRQRTETPAPRAHRAWMAPALVALALLLLRPLCELGLGGQAAFAHAGAGHVAAAQSDAGGEPAAICCAKIKDGVVLKPADAVSLAGGALGAVLLLAIVAPRGIARGASARPAFVPPPERSSYYARSARILR
jgi:hypothetical protein